MAKILIIEDLDNEDIIEQLVAALGGKAEKPGKSEKSSKGKKKEKPEEDDDEDITPDDVKEACEELKKLSNAKTVKEVLGEFDIKTPAAAAKSDEFEDIYEALNDKIDELSDDDDDDDDEVVDIDTVKKACQTFAKKEGKEELEEILEDFSISSVRGLSKLDDDDLQELYDEVSG